MAGFPGTTAPRPHQRALRRPAGALIALFAAAALAACSSANIADTIPASVGGLPESTPDRPAVPMDYPAVHDMPPARAVPTLTEDEQRRLEADLVAVRDRQEMRTGTTPKKKPPAASAYTAPPSGSGRTP
jgi:hypothetical protein